METTTNKVILKSDTQDKTMNNEPNLILNTLIKNFPISVIFIDDHEDIIFPNGEPELVKKPLKDVVKNIENYNKSSDTIYGSIKDLASHQVVCFKGASSSKNEKCLDITLIEIDKENPLIAILPNICLSDFKEGFIKEDKELKEF